MSPTRLHLTYAMIGMTAAVANAQQLFLEVNDASQFVLTGSQVKTAGLEITSATGSLTPGQLPDPFGFFLANTPAHITYGVLADEVTIDGSIILDAGWNPHGLPDARFAYGAGNQVVGPFPVLTGSAPPSVSLDANDHFVIRGNDRQLRSLALASPSGSLLPSPTATPFTHVSPNSPGHINYDSTGHVVVDGSLTLGARYNRMINGRDVSVTLEQVGAGVIGPHPLNSGYPRSPAVGVSLDRDFHLVLGGDGQALKEVIFSAPGSLLPSQAIPAPFVGGTANSSRRIQYVAPDNAGVRVNDSVTLPASWNKLNTPQIRWEATGRWGERSAGELFRIPRASRGDVVLGLDEQLNFVASGRGQTLTELQIYSRSGALLTGSTAGPFESILRRRADEVIYQGQLTIDGSVKLATEWDRSKPGDEVVYQYREQGAPTNTGPYVLSEEQIETSRRNLPLRVGLEADPSAPGRALVNLEGTGQQLHAFTLWSPSGGLQTTSSAPFSSSIRSPTRVRYAGGPVKLEGSLRTGTTFELDAAHNLSYEYETYPVGNGPLGPFSIPAEAYPPAPPTVYLGHDRQFVLSGQDVNLQTFRLLSRSGAIIPGTSSAPFASLSKNTSNEVLYLGPVQIDGEVTLDARWDFRKPADVRARYTLDTLESPDFGVDGFPATTTAAITIDDNHHFVLHGNGQELLSLRLRSRSGSLIPAETPAPFSALDANEPTNVGYTASTFVKVDGSVKLSARYNKDVGGADVTFFQRHTGTQSRPGVIREYPAANPLSVRLDQDSRFVLTGNNLSLLGLDVTSSSGSLLTGGSPDPFSIYLANTPERITYGVLGKENAITLDGSITLGSGWNALGEPDVRYQYGLQNGQRVGPFPLFREPPKDLDVVRMQLRPDYHWVLQGNGQSLAQLDILSAQGGLLPANTPAPFESLTHNTTERIQFQTSTVVTVDGELTLPAAWNRDLGIRDVTYLYQEQGADVATGPFFVTNDVYPPLPPTSRVDVSIREDDLRFSITGRGHELRELQFESESGSLLPGASAAPFTSFTENTPTSIHFATQGFVTVDGELTLDAAYNRDVAGEDVTYRYDQVGFVHPRGPFKVDAREYPPNPKQSPLRMHVNNDGQLVAEGIGQLVTQLTIESPAGSLQAEDNPAPFTDFLTNTPQVVQLSGGPVRIEGELTLPVVWTEIATDIRFQYLLEGVEDPFGPSELPGRAYPQPNVINVLVNHSGAITLFGNEQAITSIEVLSPSGSLRGLDNPIAPFSSSESSGTSQIRYASDEPLDISVLRLPVLWDNEGDADLEFIIQPAGSRPITASVRYGGAVPEPASFSLLGLAMLALFHQRPRRGQTAGHARRITTGKTNSWWLITGLLALMATSASAQSLQLHVNEDATFFLRGIGVATTGLEILSPSGSLVPAATSQPFELLLSNESSRITYGELGGTVTIDGDVTLDSGWNPQGRDDITYAFGQANVQGPFPAINPLVPLSLSLSDQQHFVLQGHQRQLRSVELNSPSGSLVPAATAAPFTELATNTTQSVGLHSATPVTLAGRLTLPTRYNPLVGGRDVSFSYEQIGRDEVQGPFVAGIFYPSTPLVDVSVATDGRLVLHGQGQHLTEIEFSSRSGALRKTDASSGPFATTDVNTTTEIRLTTPGSAVSIDGSMTLPIRWSTTHAPDIRWTTRDLSGRQSTSQRLEQSLLQGSHITLSFDEDLSFVVEGRGQSLSQFDIFSPEGALRSTERPSGFAPAVKTPQQLSFAAASPVTVDGLLTLPARLDERVVEPTVYYQYREAEQAVPNGLLQVPNHVIRDARREAGDLTIELERIGDSDVAQVVIVGTGQRLEELVLNSRSGSLVPATSPTPFRARVNRNDNGEIRYSQPWDPVRIDGRVTTTAGWNLLGTPDVTYSYSAPRSRPITAVIPLSAYPEVDPDALPLEITVRADATLVLHGRGQQLRTLTLESPAGGLLPQDTAAPFDSFTSRSPTDVTLTAMGPVELLGEVTLPVNWIEPATDLRFRYDLFAGGETIGPIEITDYPQPLRVVAVVTHTGAIWLGGDLDQIAEIEILSASGALRNVDDMLPALTTLEASAQRVRYAADQSLTPRTLELPLTWDVEAEPDLLFSYLAASGRIIRTSVVFREVPEPATRMPIGVGLLVLSCRRRSSRGS